MDDWSDINWNRRVALIRAEDTIEGFMLTIVNMGFFGDISASEFRYLVMMFGLTHGMKIRMVP